MSVKGLDWPSVQDMDGLEGRGSGGSGGGGGDALLPSDWACRTRMISLGLPMAKSVVSVSKNRGATEYWAVVCPV